MADLLSKDPNLKVFDIEVNSKEDRLKGTIAHSKAQKKDKEVKVKYHDKSANNSKKRDSKNKRNSVDSQN